LAEHKRDVTIVEMGEAIAAEAQHAVRIPLMKAMKNAEIDIITGAKITKFLENGIEYRKEGNQMSALDFDNIVLALGVLAHDLLSGKAKNIVQEVFVIGDADEPGHANTCIESGVKAAFAI
jgi:NADH dehydrogenase FAD-containing subunit